MLKLTKKADYGLIALRHLAAGSAAASAKEIADAYGIPLPLLSKVLQRLARQGFLHSEQGANGGYRLARGANQINALEVIRALDGPIILTSCFAGRRQCGQSPRCTVRTPLRRVHMGILRFLENVTISDMAQEVAEEAPVGGLPVLHH